MGKGGLGTREGRGGGWRRERPKTTETGEEQGVTIESEGHLSALISTTKGTSPTHTNT